MLILLRSRTRRFASSSIWFVHVRLSTSTLGTPHRSKTGIRYWVRNPMQRLTCASLPFRITTGRVRVDLDRETKRLRTRGGGGWGTARSLASERSATGKRGSSIPLFAVVSTYIHVSRSSAGAVFVCSAWRPGIEAGHIHPRSHSPCLSYVVNERFVIRSVRSTVSIRIAFVVVVSGVILSLPAPVQLARSIETVPRRKQGATTEPFTPAI